MPATVQIKAALIRLHTGIKAADGPTISASLTELDGLLATHREELDPRLTHFLEGRSYAKALAWLGDAPEFGRPAFPPGGCVRKE
ncbi:MAG TPA: hypothetical protein VEB66_06870 [Opitutaceae bacterium]|nr:hypothetical protein [Opitutaceae bacterium]